MLTLQLKVGTCVNHADCEYKEKNIVVNFCYHHCIVDPFVQTWSCTLGPVATLANHMRYKELFGKCRHSLTRSHAMVVRDHRNWDAIHAMVRFKADKTQTLSKVSSKWYSTILVTCQDVCI